MHILRYFAVVSGATYFSLVVRLLYLSKKVLGPRTKIGRHHEEGEGTDIAILRILLNWDGLKHIKTYEMPYFSGLRSVTTSFLNVKHRGYTVQTKQRQYEALSMG